MEAKAVPLQEVVVSRDAPSLRIAIMSELRYLREGLAQLLDGNPLVSIVRSCADLSEVVALGPTLDADVVLLDATIREGAAAVRRGLDIAPGIRIIACGVRETENDIIAWAEAGVIGYIPGTAALADLPRLIMDIHNGEQVCSSRVAAGLLRQISRSKRGIDRAGPILASELTKRERQTAELIRAGLSDKEIAQRLSIGVATAKSHVHKLLRKLNVRRRSEVADYLR